MQQETTEYESFQDESHSLETFLLKTFSCVSAQNALLYVCM